MTQFQIASKHAAILSGAGVLAAVVTLGLLPAPSARAADKTADKTRAQVLQQVLDCRAIADTAQRLACYDGAVARMDQAEQSGDIVVVDREQVRAAKRDAFGFSMPHLNIFDRGDKPVEIDRVSGVVASARINGDGKWVVTLEDGATWVQVDNERVDREPHKGSTAEIRKAAFGSFFLNLDGQHAIRAHRVN